MFVYMYLCIQYVCVAFVTINIEICVIYQHLPVACRCHFKTLRNRRFRFPGAAAGNAQAVLNVPPVLIVQPRKHRKVSTTLV